MLGFIDSASEKNIYLAVLSYKFAYTISFFYVLRYQILY